MAFNDPIAEMLTKLRNAKGARHRYIDVAHSKLKVNILEILKKQGFIDNFLVSEERHLIRVFLRYKANRESMLRGLNRVSSGGLRRYITCDQIPRIFNGMGIAILSTSKGVMDGDTARSMKIGGEFLCTVW